jgi:hypothetical protein
VSPSESHRPWTGQSIVDNQEFGSVTDDAFLDEGTQEVLVHQRNIPKLRWVP